MDDLKVLYYNAWEYNSVRLIKRIEKLIFDNDGVIVSNYKKELENYKIIPSYRDGRTDETKAVYSNYLNYITFVVDGFLYYLQLDDNPFFEHYFSKEKIGSDLTSEYKHYCIYLKRDFLFDCLYKFDCSPEEIKEIANMIFNQLLSSKESQICTTRRKNYYTRRFENIPDKTPEYSKHYSILKNADTYYQEKKEGIAI